MTSWRKKLWLSWKNKFGKEVSFASFILLVGWLVVVIVVDLMLIIFLLILFILRGGVGGLDDGKEQKLFYCYEKKLKGKIVVLN